MCKQYVWCEFYSKTKSQNKKKTEAKSIKIHKKTILVVMYFYIKRVFSEKKLTFFFAKVVVRYHIQTTGSVPLFSTVSCNSI